jgi:hypothetical protein
MRLKGWSDVMASGAVSIGGGIAVKHFYILLHIEKQACL